MPTVLALDSATTACSAAVRRDEEAIVDDYAEMKRGQSEKLLGMVRDIMATANVSFAEVDLIVTTVGPGSYTGLRIGLAAARGLALATGAPLRGFTTFETVAMAQPQSPNALLVALDSKRADLYVQLFDTGLSPIDGPAALELPEILERLPAGPLSICGNAAKMVMDADGERRFVLSPGPALPHARTLVQMAFDEIAAHPSPFASQEPQPLYLRPPHVTAPTK